jgi:NitT/TauT family transport system substrate-binding protein
MFTRLTVKLKILLFVLVASLFMPTTGMAQTKIKVGHLKGAHFDLLFVAKDKGMLAKQGLDVTLVNLNRPSDHPAAIIAKSIDIGYTSPMVLLQATQNGLDLVGIGTVARETKSHPDVALVAHNGSGIKTAKDLVGKKVGVSGLNTNMHIMLKRWISDHGVDTSKIQFVEVPMPHAGDVLRAGDIDAMAFIQPYLGRALTKKEGYKVASFIADVKDGALMGVWAVTSGWAKAHGDTIKKFNAAMKDALDYVNAHPEAIAEVDKKYNGFASKVVPEFDLSFEPSDFDIWIEVGKQAGVLKNPPDPKSLMIK